MTFAEAGTTLATVTPDADGIATWSTAGLAVGRHTIRISYGGDANSIGSAATLSQTVNKAATTIVVVGLPGPSTVGQLSTFTATVNVTAPGSGVPTGMVTFKDGRTILGTVALGVSGTASIGTSALAVGSHTITVSYGGSVIFGAGSGSTSQQVGPAISDSLAALVTSRVHDVALMALLGESSGV